jgi:homoserine kinase
MALDVWNELTVERAEKFELIVIGEGADKLPKDETNLVCVGVQTAFKHAGKEAPALKYTLKNKIPFGRGLGSSSAAIVSGLIAGFALAGHELKVWGSKRENLYSGGVQLEPEELLQLASDLEGHPDNVSPCIYGGIQLAIKIDQEDGRHWRSSRIEVPHDMQLVAFVPNDVGETATLRAVLPDSYSRADAVFNIGRVAFLVAALSQNRLCDLRFGAEDCLHQPYRADAVYSHLRPIVKAACDAGAHGAYLSGAGPTVLAITSGAAGSVFTQSSEEHHDTVVAEAMIAAAQKAGWPGRCFVTRPNNGGAHISKADPPYSQGVLQFLGGGQEDNPI